jgi:sugar phosphate isomerase/epimerase
LVNSVSEAAEIVERVKSPSIKLLSDLYHVAKEHERFADTGAAASELAHVHVAAPGSRGMPRAGEMDDVYIDYFRVLRRAGYDHRISVESRNPTVDEAAEGVTFLRNLWSDVAGSVPE